MIELSCQMTCPGNERAETDPLLSEVSPPGASEQVPSRHSVFQKKALERSCILPAQALSWTDKGAQAASTASGRPSQGKGSWLLRNRYMDGQRQGLRLGSRDEYLQPGDQLGPPNAFVFHCRSFSLRI